MDSLFKVLLFIHIAGGTLALLTGLFNVARIKGDRIHVKVGKVFFFSMMSAGISSLILAVLHPNYFLFMVGIFTVYMVGTGQRYIVKKELVRGGSPVDWGLSIIMLLSGMAFIGLGARSLLNSNYFGLVFIAFGLFGLLFVQQDYKHYTGRSRLKNFWLVAHLQRMIGGFIAAVTAFLVVNSNHVPDLLPGFLLWLLPTLVLTPLIIRWSRKLEMRKV